MEYTIANHGDLVERQAASFISTSLPSYEEIWKRYIGHKGNGKMADMIKINESDEAVRRNFAQHHYTVLESIYFMKLLVDDASTVQQINSFDPYRKTIDQIMAFQAHSGRLRDNMEKCFSVIGKKAEAKKSQEQLDTFYKERHVFIHGRKVPFGLDSDNLFKISKIKHDTTDNVGFGLEMPWEQIQDNDLQYLEHSLSESFQRLVSIVNGLLSNLLEFINNLMSDKKLTLEPPATNIYSAISISGGTTPISASISTVHSASGSV